MATATICKRGATLPGLTLSALTSGHSLVLVMGLGARSVARPDMQTAQSAIPFSPKMGSTTTLLIWTMILSLNWYVYLLRVLNFVED